MKSGHSLTNVCTLISMETCEHPTRHLRRVTRLGRAALAGLGVLPSTGSAEVDRGCERCADDHVVLWHLERICGDQRRHVVLMRCQGCRSLYEVPSVGRSGIVRITTAQALRWHPAYAASLGRAPGPVGATRRVRHLTLAG